MIDRQGDQLGKVLVCFHAVTIQHRGRATRSIDQREREMLMFIKRDTRMATAYARILLHIAFLFCGKSEQREEWRREDTLRCLRLDAGRGRRRRGTG